MMKKHMPPPLHGKKEIKNSPEILEVLRQVKVNIPLLDMIKQVPHICKNFKGLVHGQERVKCDKEGIPH